MLRGLEFQLPADGTVNLLTTQLPGRVVRGYGMA